MNGQLRKAMTAATIVAAAILGGCSGQEMGITSPDPAGSEQIRQEQVIQFNDIDDLRLGLVADDAVELLWSAPVAESGNRRLRAASYEMWWIQAANRGASVRVAPLESAPRNGGSRERYVWANLDSGTGYEVLIVAKNEDGETVATSNPVQVQTTQTESPPPPREEPAEQG